MSANDFILSDDDHAQLAHANPYLAHPAHGLRLLTELVGRPPLGLGDEAAQALDKLHRLVHEDYLDLGDGHPGAARMFRTLDQLVQSLEELVFFPDLANKTVVGIGGGFSAGKSRFVNSVLGEHVLPEALAPSTAIPTFVLDGPPGITAVNAFGQIVELDEAALAAISHDFHTRYQEQFGVEVGFAHVIRLLMLRSPRFRWPNLALLDTPGYDRGDDDSKTVRDDTLALEQLRNADHVLWLLSARNGCIRQDDLTFLREAAPRHPVFFVVAQADLVAPAEVGRVLALTRQAVMDAGIECAGVAAWAAPPHEDLGAQSGGDDVLAWLEHIAASPKYTDKRMRCADLIDTHMAHNARLLAHNRALLSELNALRVLSEPREAPQQTALARQIARLKQQQQEVALRVDKYRKLKAGLLEAIGALLGDQVLDEAPSAGSEIVLPVAQSAFANVPRVGERLVCRVIESRSDLKKLRILIQDEVQTAIPYSAIRDDWGADPRSIDADAGLHARVVEVEKGQVTLAFSLAACQGCPRYSLDSMEIK